MNNILLPTNEQIIVDVYNFFDNNIYLCGGGADHYLLSKNYSKLKDLDFITTSDQISKINNQKFVKYNSKLGYVAYFGHWNYEYTIEIFIVDNILNDEIFLCDQLGVYITSIKYRLKIINQILNTETLDYRHTDFSNLKQQYEDLEL